ncbi:MAG TPA: hypothetical protein VFE84_11145 [Patescibacteria group bacterium]|nr:hypothetical protein [Patescibacteria group bacterium]
MARKLDNLFLPRGAGGMGEDSRAMDRRLERLMATRALPSSLSSSAGLRHRLDRVALRVEPPPRADR